MITQDLLKELLDYNPDTGVFTWKARPLDKFKSARAFKMWNTRYSGREAGCLYKANGKPYLMIGIYGRLYQSHRLAYQYVYGENPKNQIDHIDGNGSNNKIVNLRSVTIKVNARNQRLHRNNTSGISGVNFEKLSRKWRARIHGIELGSFEDKFEAICVRKSAERHYNYHLNHGFSRAL